MNQQKINSTTIYNLFPSKDIFVIAGIDENNFVGNILYFKKVSEINKTQKSIDFPNNIEYIVNDKKFYDRTKKGVYEQCVKWVKENLSYECEFNEQV